MEISLEGKVALVTGGSKGIGKAIAASFVQAGASVMISSRKEDALISTTREIASKYDSTDRVDYVAANAGDESSPELVVRTTIERFGSLDILVNNAATNPYFGPIIGIDAQRADKIMAVNVRGVLLWTKQCWEVLWSKPEFGTAVVVNIASIGGLGIEPMIGYYNVSKSAVIHMTRQLANELGPKVRVNSISPGVVRTDFARALWEPNEERLAARLPLGRIGEPEDVANAALFLASDLSSWGTGQNLVVDGGTLVSS